MAVFHGPVRVPEGVNRNGNAKITLTFPDWKEGNVAPATVEVPCLKDGGKTSGQINLVPLSHADVTLSAEN